MSADQIMEIIDRLSAIEQQTKSNLEDNKRHEKRLDGIDTKFWGILLSTLSTLALTLFQILLKN